LPLIFGPSRCFSGTIYCEHTSNIQFYKLAVAKALRRAAEGKASAQAEAAEWKRRFELERARNQQLERKGF